MTTSTPVFALPGLDGTGLLLREFRDASPPEYAVSVLPIPRDWPQDYEHLSDQLLGHMEASPDCVIIAESFSGPIAIKIASRLPSRVQAVVLVATFATSPVAAVARLMPWELFFRMPLPGFAARRAMLGNDAPTGLVRELRAAVRQVPASVLAQRMREVIGVDVTAELSGIKCPLMHLRPAADRLVPSRCLRAIQEAQPNIHVHEIDGPHLILQRHPDASWNAIAEFLRSLADK